MPRIPKRASVIISLALAVSFIVIFAVIMCVFPWFSDTAPIIVELRDYFDEKDIFSISGRVFFTVWSYVILAAAEACCIVILILLLRVRKGLVFTSESVACIRFVSWGCVFIGLVFLTAQYFHPLAFIVALAMAFLGLCLRVVKNVIEEAVEIKSENDLTV